MAPKFWTVSTQRSATASTKCSGSGLGSGPTAPLKSQARSRSRSRLGQKFVLSTDHVYELELHSLQGETEAEDDVVRARDPDGAVGLEDATRFLQPPDIELVILREPHRANRVTTLGVALPVAFGG